MCQHWTCTDQRLVAWGHWLSSAGSYWYVLRGDEMSNHKSDRDNLIVTIKYQWSMNDYSLDTSSIVVIPSTQHCMCMIFSACTDYCMICDDTGCTECTVGYYIDDDGTCTGTELFSHSAAHNV